VRKPTPARRRLAALGVLLDRLQANVAAPPDPAVTDPAAAGAVAAAGAAEAAPAAPAPAPAPAEPVP